MRPSVTVRIQDNDYKLTALDAVTGRRIYLRLVKILAPGLAKLPTLKDADSTDKLLAVVVGSLDQIDEATLDAFCDAFGQCTELIVDDKTRVTLSGPAFGEHFCGRYAAMTQWLLESIKVNKFIDFLATK